MDEQSVLHWWDSLDNHWRSFFKIQLQPLHHNREQLDQYNPEELRGIFEQYHLTVQNVSVSNLKPLEALSLGSLTLRQIRTLESIKGIEKLKLTNLELSDCAVADLMPLKSCVWLSRLDIDANEIDDFSPISSLKSLSQLRIRNGALTSLEAIAPLPSLQLLYLIDMTMQSLKGIERFPMLVELILENCTTTDLRLIENLRLATLDISRTTISDLTVLDQVNPAEIILPENISFEARQAFAKAHPYSKVYVKNDGDFYWNRRGFFSRYKNYKVIEPRDELEADMTVQYDGYQYDHYNEAHIWFFKRTDANPYNKLRVRISEYEEFLWKDYVEEIDQGVG